jgi:hypothetical protein
MQEIFLLAFACAGSLAVQLLAIVLVILTRPKPKPLLWSFYATAMIVSVGISAIVLWVFRTKGTILGTTSHKVNPTVYIVVGVIALGVAVFAATKRGRELIGREMEKGEKDAKPKGDGSIADKARAKADKVKSDAAAALKRGSVWVAIGAGVFMAAPSPFSLGAVGIMVRNDYRLPTQLLLIVAFSAITYIVVEIPVISYLFWPEGTAARVEAFSVWLGTHKIQAVAAVAAVIGIALIAKGLTG